MSIIGDVVKRAIGTISAAEGIAVTYHNGASWVALDNPVIHQRAGVPSMDDERGEDQIIDTATLTLASDAPLLAIETRIQFEGREWRVVQVDTFTQQQRYMLEALTKTAYKPNRGKY